MGNKENNREDFELSHLKHKNIHESNKIILFIICGVRTLAILLGLVSISISLANLLGFIPIADGDGKSVMPFDYRVMESIPFLFYGLIFIFPYKYLKAGFYYVFSILIIVVPIFTCVILLFPSSFFVFNFYTLVIGLIEVLNIWAFFWIGRKKKTCPPGY
jgi:hypothetical protein